MEKKFERLNIAILALGGQGGGVLADWIQEVARHEGWLAQGTSVPGVAQRTGSTVYYVELVKPDDKGRSPVMAQMPTPGDVDIVIASELMETGRALLRGFSTADRTTLIGSSNRVYSISEKSAMGDGRGSSQKIFDAGRQRSKRFICFDMEEAADKAGSVISSVMFGALAGSGALPFGREAFEHTIRESGIAVSQNLSGFSAGFVAAQIAPALPQVDENPAPVPTTPAGREFEARVRARLPTAAHRNAIHGIARLMDYQDARYAALYLDRLEAVAERDMAPFILTEEAARHLALWMSYEDTVRVADLKIRASRGERVQKEVRVGKEDLLQVTEFMHPRLQEICETMPASIGRAVLNSKFLNRILAPFFQAGRHVETTSLHWFLMLRFVASMRRIRPRSLRYVEEQERIEEWLQKVRLFARNQPELALEVVRCQRLIKGYGDTFDRGLGNFRLIMDHVADGPIGAQDVAKLREAALADDAGTALAGAIGSSSDRNNQPAHQE
ncbi:MAG: indolepyruvate oxidoreductase subunit beta family protein [Sphingopyxis sp.]|nr:indolepyruvate oxidoreductase subunit beta family protein [Sphingopyxis sp.]